MGSLLITFQPIDLGFSAPLVSLWLVIIADILHTTTNILGTKTYEILKEIEKDLHISNLKTETSVELAPSKFYDSFKNEFWYKIRSLSLIHI